MSSALRPEGWYGARMNAGTSFYFRDEYNGGFGMKFGPHLKSRTCFTVVIRWQVWLHGIIVWHVKRVLQMFTMFRSVYRA